MADALVHAGLRVGQEGVELLLPEPARSVLVGVPGVRRREALHGYPCGAGAGSAAGSMADTTMPSMISANSLEPVSTVVLVVRLS